MASRLAGSFTLPYRYAGNPNGTSTGSIAFDQSPQLYQWLSSRVGVNHDRPNNPIHGGHGVSKSPQALLKKPPFSPSNVNLFTPQVYESASAMQPAAQKTIPDAQIKGQLLSTLQRQLNGDCWTALKTVSSINDPALSKTIPDIRLRAALLSLKGTAGQGAIDAIRKGTFNSVSFGTPPQADSIAQVIPPADGQTKPSIVINSKYQYEDFRLLGTALSHETMHDDPQNSAKEELINNAIDTTVYGQVLLTSPELAKSGTELSRRLNTKLMARLNSRDTNGELRLLSSQGNVYPGGQELANFAAAFQNGGADTPGNATLRANLRSITGKNPGNANFDDETINLLDKNQKVLSPSEIVRLARTLGLKTQ